MSLSPREAGKKAFGLWQPKKLPKNGELTKLWGPDWEAEWLAGWEEAEQEYLLKQRRSQDFDLEM